MGARVPAVGRRVRHRYDGISSSAVALPGVSIIRGQKFHDQCLGDELPSSGRCRRRISGRTSGATIATVVPRPRDALPLGQAEDIRPRLGVPIRRGLRDSVDEMRPTSAPGVRASVVVEVVAQRATDEPPLEVAVGRRQRCRRGSSAPCWRCRRRPCRSRTIRRRGPCPGLADVADEVDEVAFEPGDRPSSGPRGPSSEVGEVQDLQVPAARARLRAAAGRRVDEDLLASVDPEVRLDTPSSDLHAVSRVRLVAVRPSSSGRPRGQHLERFDVGTAELVEHAFGREAPVGLYGSE